MARWPTGVAVLGGYGDDGTPLGFVVGSLCSVSLQPMLVAFCVQKSSSTWAQLRRRACFGASFLAEDQGDLCARFATGNPARRFEHQPFDLSPARQPRLPACCAWLDLRLTQEIEAGDHWLVLCEVTSLALGTSNQPLAFARGRLNRLEPCQRPAPHHLERWEQALDALQFSH